MALPSDPETSTTIIDDLPDTAFHQILSSASITQTVQTCILSKRWSHVWRTTPFLEFTEKDFESERSFEERLKKFTQFVNCFLLLRESINMEKFRLEFTDHRRARPFYPLACGWVFYALQHNTKNLSIPMSEMDLPRILEAIFNNRNLKDLSLQIEPEDVEGCASISPRTVSLNGLARLSLSNVHLVDELLNKILKGCPLLNTLELVNSNCDITKLESEMLRILSIDCNPMVESENKLRVLNLPNLTDLHLAQVGTSLRDLRAENMSLIQEASIDFRFEVYQPNLLESGTGNILSGLVSCETLKLDGITTPYYIGRDLGLCGIFENLKFMKLGGFCMVCNYKSLHKFLCHCPNLANLQLEHWEYCEEHTVEMNSLRTHHFECNKLSKIEFVDVNEDDEDDILILQETLKRNSMGMERVEIVSSLSVKD